MSALRAALVAATAAVLTAACGAGQLAQTSQEQPTIDGTQGRVGSLQLENVAFHAPPKVSYAVGATVPLTIYIVNNGRSADSLTDVTSAQFTAWQVVDSATVGASAAPSTPSPQPIAPGSALGLGQVDTGVGGVGSTETIVLSGLKTTLHPGTTVKVTFTFAKAGQTTLTVPVQLSAEPELQTLRPSYSPPAG